MTACYRVEHPLEVGLIAIQAPIFQAAMTGRRHFRRRRTVSRSMSAVGINRRGRLPDAIPGERRISARCPLS